MPKIEGFPPRAVMPYELQMDDIPRGYVLGGFLNGTETYPIFIWDIPQTRCLFPIEGIHVSKSLAKTIRKNKFEIRFDTRFSDVIRNCLREPGNNWLNEPLIERYCEIHELGWAHCSECWLDGELVGGVYGIAINGAFFAESMFHRATDASKVALWAMINKVRALGFQLFDAQMTNPHLVSLGCFEIPYLEYLERMSVALASTTEWSLNYDGIESVQRVIKSLEEKKT